MLVLNSGDTRHVFAVFSVWFYFSVFFFCCRHQFFLNAKQQFLSGKLRFLPENEIVNLSALLVVIHQIEFAKPSKSILTSATDSEQFLPPGYQSDTYRNLVMVQCAKLGAVSEEAAKNRFLKAAFSSPFFGIHLHEARDDGGKVIHVGVGREGITEYGEDWKLSKRLVNETPIY